MKLVRIWFEKDNSTRYISHLDLTRCMSRMLKRAGIPIWYTEGFNPRPFLTFALPLSLGVRGFNESMDVKLMDDDMTFDKIVERINKTTPHGIKILCATDPAMKPGAISYAEYTVLFSSSDISKEIVSKKLNEFLEQNNIMTIKKAKSGEKEINLKHFIDNYKASFIYDKIKLDIFLPAGSRESVNPSLIVKEFEKFLGGEVDSDITRNNLYNQNFEVFR